MIKTIIIIMSLIVVLYVYQTHNSMKKKNNKQGKTIIIIGGGLAGIVCALECSNNKHNKIFIIEKNKDIGGNSMKASSGISLLNDKMNDDINKKKYYEDIVKSSETFSTYTIELISAFVNNSNKAYKWLTKHGIVFDEIIQMGGHGVPRTHTIKNKPIGFAIMNNLIKQIHEKKNVKIITNVDTKEIICDNGMNKIIYNENETLQGDVLVIATGGYSYNNDLLYKITNDVKFMNMSTTNGEFAMGDGLRLMSKHAKIIDLDKIQIHPTGFVDEMNKKNKIKYLAPELLRSIGGILINSKGERFCDELDTRKNIYEKMLEEKEDMYMILISKKLAHKYLDIMNFYVNKKLLKLAKINVIANDHNMNMNKIMQTIKFHNDNNNMYFDIADDYYYGMITPVVHYCMGGIQINGNANVIGLNGLPIKNIYAIGEVTGGLHSENRLGGNSLAECVIFGLITSININSNNDVYVQNDVHNGIESDQLQ